jgi:hypothetical protein
MRIIYITIIIIIQRRRIRRQGVDQRLDRRLVRFQRTQREQRSKPVLDR